MSMVGGIPGCTVLDRADRDMVSADPFPHIVVRDALPADLFESLRASTDAFAASVAARHKGPNRYHRLSASELLSGECGVLPRCWEDFVRTHVERRFFHRALNLFGSHLDASRAAIEPLVGQTLEQCAVAPRFAGVAEVQLDCQFVHVSPTLEPASPLGPHLDREVALWGGLLYLGEQHGGGGGDLELCRFRSPDQRAYWRDRSIARANVMVEKVIPAAPNTFVLFLNSPDSVHGVTPRLAGGEGRNLVNFVCELRHPLFDVGPWQVSREQFAPL